MTSLHAVNQIQKIILQLVQEIYTMNSYHVSEEMDVKGKKYSWHENAQYVKEGHWVRLITVEEKFVLRA